MGDYLTEMLVGERGAIRVPAKIVLMPSGDCQYGKKHAIWGVAIGPELLVNPESAGCHEMWECELIIIPKRKFKSHKAGDPKDRPSYRFWGWTPEDMMLDGLGDPKSWGDEYFAIEKQAELWE